MLAQLHLHRISLSSCSKLSRCGTPYRCEVSTPYNPSMHADEPMLHPTLLRWCPADCAQCLSACLHGDDSISFDVSQDHLQSLVDLRRLVDAVVGNQGHPHCIDGHKLGQPVARSDGEVLAPACGVDIIILLQVLAAGLQ